MWLGRVLHSVVADWVLAQVWCSCEDAHGKPPRYQYHQRCDEAGAVTGFGGVDGEEADEELYISSLTVAEIRRGILEISAGKKRRDLQRWFSGPDGPQALFAGRVLPFDERAGLAWARLMAEGTAKGRPQSPLDMIVAAIAETNDCVIVTGNERHFAGLRLRVLNPLHGA